MYINDHGPFSFVYAMKDRDKTNIVHSWNMYDSPSSKLQRLAMRMLSQGMKEFFYKEVFKHLQLHPQYEAKQVKCGSGKKLGLWALQLKVVIPLL
jgi:hypothetical protein